MSRISATGDFTPHIDLDGATARHHWSYWLGWALSALIIVFFCVDGAIKLVPLDIVISTLEGLGYPAEHARLIGIITIAGVVLYAIPRTSVLGAIVLTGLFGGAIATHLRVNSPLFSHTLFGFYMGVITWLGLYLREPKLHALLPFRR